MAMTVDATAPPIAGPGLVQQEKSRQNIPLLDGGAMKRLFERTLETALIGLFVVTIVCVVIQVFYRYALNNPLPWTEELAKLAFMWMLFLGLCLAEKDHMHIAVDFFVDRMPKAIAAPLRVVVEIFCIIVLLAVCWFSIGYIAMQKAMRSVSLDVSMMYFTLAVPAGCLLYSIYKTFDLIRFVKDGYVEPERPVIE